MPKYLVIVENREYDLVQVLNEEMEGDSVVLHLRQMKRLNHSQYRDKFWRVSYHKDYEKSPYRCWNVFNIDDEHIKKCFGDLSRWTKEQP